MMLFRSRKGDPIVNVAGEKEYKENSHQRGISIKELQEGDIILFLGKPRSSKMISFLSTGNFKKASHVGQMMKLDGELWFVESVFHNNPNHTRPYENKNEGREALITGVSACAFPFMLISYAKSAVFRPTPRLSDTELDTMREEFLKLYGSSYEFNFIRLMLLVPGMPVKRKHVNKFCCSQLTAYLFSKIGRVKKSRRLKYVNFRPTDIPKAVNCKYKGFIKGTREMSDYERVGKVEKQKENL